jgi:WhiB family transcriptional regulator, redox-sensing transcriptional regulator
VTGHDHVELATTGSGELGHAWPCRDKPDLWFSVKPADLELAKLICGACPAIDRCLAAAVDRGEPWGVWGGQIFESGRVIAHKRGPGRPRKQRAA